MKASTAWPCVIVGILAVNVGIVAVTVAVSRSGGGYVVEEGYDQKALNWDVHKAKMERQRERGWKVDCDITSATRGSGSLRTRVTDRDGMPLGNTRVKISLFQAAWPHEAQATATVLTDSDGVAMSEFVPIREGKWVIDVSLRNGESVYDARLERDVWFGKSDAQVKASDSERRPM